jgi:hypothetical protein
MIDWMLTHRRDVVRFSRWILFGCALALIEIMRLPKTPIDRMISIAFVILVGIVFAVWLIITLITIFAPHLFDELHRRRAAARAPREGSPN